MNPIERIVVPTRDGYDRWSDVYDGDGNPLVLLEEPHVARLLGDVRGLSVLDVGCGTGRHALRLAEQGARVTGVDFSAGMLGKARQKPGAERVTFVEHNITASLPFAPASFDRVLSCLVLDHVPDVKAFFAELRRVCRRTDAKPLLVETLANRSPKRDRKLFHYFDAAKRNTKIITQ